MTRSRRFWVTLITLIVGSVLLGAAALLLFANRADDAESRENAQRIEKIEQARAKEKAANAAQQQAESTIEDCRRDDEVAETLRKRGRCREASEARVTVAEIGATGAPGAASTVPGPRGPGPTAAQVLAAVRASIGPALNAACGGSCNGTDGADGEDGQSITGPRGPAGESIQGPKGDTGAKGDTGSAGVNGQDGRGIADAQCGADGRWTVTYTDGTTADAGVCRADLIPAPEPEPTP